jgi:hypothetical protein
MKRNGKLIMGIIIMLMFIGIGYAAISSTLSINGIGMFKHNSWDIVWDDIQIKSNVTYIDPDTGDETQGTVEYTDDTHTGIEYTAALLIPGDKFEFTVDMWNKGTIPAYASVVDRTTQMLVNEIETSEYSRWFDYSIDYTDGRVIKPLNTLQPNERKNVTVTLELKADITNEDLQTLPSSFEGGISILFEQYAKNKKNERPCQTTGAVAVGSEVTCANEKFNVIAIGESDYTLLAQNRVNLESDKQSSSGGNIKFSKDAYWWDTENDSLKDTYTNTYVYDSNSKLEEHLDNYKHFFYMNDLDVNVVLPSLEDLTTSVCSEEAGVYTCDTTTYDFLSDTSIWLGNYKDNEKLYVLDANDGITSAKFNVSDKYGIRPVIKVVKTDVEATE